MAQKRKSMIALAKMRAAREKRTPQIPITIYSEMDKLKRVRDWYKENHDTENFNLIDGLLNNLVQKKAQIESYQNSMGPIPMDRVAGYDKMVATITRYVKQSSAIEPPKLMVLENLKLIYKQKVLEAYESGEIPETEPHCVRLKNQILQLESQIGR